MDLSKEGVNADVIDMDRSSNFMEQVSTDDLRGLQLKDADLQPLISWLEGPSEDQPNEAALQQHSPSTRHFWLCRTQLHLVKGVLHY